MPHGSLYSRVLQLVKKAIVALPRIHRSKLEGAGCRAGYSAEEQLTGEARHGGLQIAVYPMEASSYEAMREAYVEEPPLRCDACP